MKTICLFMLGVVFVASCQQQRHALSSDLVNVVSNSFNPTLMGFQFLTAELKRESGKWAKQEADHEQTFGDSAKAILAEFECLEFKNQHDTLTVSYSLKEMKVTNIKLEFVGEYQLKLKGDSTNADTSNYKFESNVKQLADSEKFKPNEGRLTFYEIQPNITQIIHEYGRGVANNKITYTQQ